MFELNKCRKKILEYGDLVSKYYYDPDFINDEMNSLYREMKEMAPLFTKKGLIKDDFAVLVRTLRTVEDKLPRHFILENEPEYDHDYNVDKNEILDHSEEEIINYIVHRVRSFLLAHYSVNGNLRNVKLCNIDLLGQCSNVSMNVKFVCEALKIPCKIITIVPAFYSGFNVYGKGGNHQFCLVTIGDKEYIADLTYSQFFTMRENNLNRIGIPFLGGCNVGVYMTFDEKSREFAESLMRDGWVEATDENKKLYFDAFAISYRNGLYYENKGEVSYTADYTAEDYMNFLKEEDSQVNHESLEELGCQKRLLKDKYLNFDINK